MSALEIIEQVLERHSRPPEHRRSSQDFWSFTITSLFAAIILSVFCEYIIVLPLPIELEPSSCLPLLRLSPTFLGILVEKSCVLSPLWPRGAGAFGLRPWVSHIRYPSTVLSKYQT